jgi:hypothetical protein
MPRCVLGELCLFPQLDLVDGHKCRRCKQHVHVFCAQEDPLAAASENLTCLSCIRSPSIMPPTAPPFRSLKDTPTTTRHLKSNQTSTKRKKLNESKRRSNTPISEVPLLSVDSSQPDYLLLKPVAFNVDDRSQGSQLYQYFGGDETASNYLSHHNGKRYLLGTVIRASNNKKRAGGATSSDVYDIQWEQSDLGVTSSNIQYIFPAISLYEMVFSSKQSSISTKRSTWSNEIFSPDLQNLLLKVDNYEHGSPESSDDDDSEKEVPQDDGNHHMRTQLLFQDVPDTEAMEDTEETNNGSEFQWSTGILPPPPDRSNRRPTHVTPALTGHFTTPISSFLAFIPMRIFNSIAYYSNLYAHQCIQNSGNANISGKRWDHDISLNEIMKFFGVLFKMVLRPTPGQSYQYCWNDPQWHPYTMFMRLRRFQQIRSVLHFNDNSSINGSHDAAFKVCHKLVYQWLLKVVIITHIPQKGSPTTQLCQIDLPSLFGTR